MTTTTLSANPTGIDLSKIILIAEEAYGARNAKTIEDMGNQATDTGQSETTPVVTLGRKLQNVADGIYDAIHSYEAKSAAGRVYKNQGIGETIVYLMERHMKVSGQELVADGAGGFVLAQVGQPDDPDAVEAIAGELQAAQDLEMALKQMLTAMTTAYEILMDGEVYVARHLRTSQRVKQDPAAIRAAFAAAAQGAIAPAGQVAASGAVASSRSDAIEQVLAASKQAD